MIELDYYHFVLSSELMKLGTEHQQLLTSERKKQQHILCLVVKIHNNTYCVAKGIKHEDDQDSGSNFQFRRNRTGEPFNLHQENTISEYNQWQTLLLNTLMVQQINFKENKGIEEWLGIKRRLKDISIYLMQGCVVIPRVAYEHDVTMRKSKEVINVKAG